MFDDINLEYNGKTYSITADKVLPLIAQIENIVTVVELAQMASEGRPPLAKIAMAYGAILRYAGAKAKDDELYRAFFQGDDTGLHAQQTIETLMVLMVPDVPETGQSAPTGKKRKKSNT